MDPVILRLDETSLRSALENDQAVGIPALRSGKISRSHYARLFGCVRSNLSRFANVFAEYERELNIKTGPQRHIEAMRSWLETAYTSKQLKITAGKLDRSQFEKHFKLRGGAYLTRYPEIRNLFDAFDARAVKEEYVPATKALEITQLKSILRDRTLLNKDRLSLSRPKLSNATGIPQFRLSEPLFLTLIVARETEIFENAKVSKIDPYFNGRVYSFGDLVTTWPVQFLEKVGVQFKLGFSGKNPGTTKNAYQRLFQVLSWIGESKSQHSQFVMAEVHSLNRIVNDAYWEDALYEYRDYLLASISAKNGKKITIDKWVKELRLVLKTFGPSRIFPELSVSIPGVKNSRVNNRNLRSIAEVIDDKVTDRSSDYVKFVNDQLQRACEKYGLQSDVVGDAKDFLESLSIEAGTSMDLPADPSKGVQILLHRRLDALRRGAVKILDDAVTAYERGQDLLATADLDGENFEKIYFGSATNNFERKKVLREFFPDGSLTPSGFSSRNLSNLLALIEQRFAGIPPAGGVQAHGPYGQFFPKRYLENGGVTAIDSLLFPGRDAVGAVLTLYLIESGANVGVGRELDENCAELSDLEGHVRISGNKARAKGKPIIVDLPVHSPAVRGIEWLRSTSRRLRANCPDAKDKLFLVKIGDRVQLATSFWFTGWFKSFAATIPSLERLRLTPNMLRPSVLLQAALANDGRLAVGIAIGQHGSAVSQGYQQKFPTRLLYDAQIRRFQSAFEVVVVSAIEGAAIKLGISAAQFEARLGQIRPTGLGTFCQNSSGRTGTAGTTCSSVDCWNECPHLLIVAEVEAIAALQIWQSSLRTAQPDWERDRPERWDEVWLPWLCLTDVVAEKMSRGPLIKIWNAAGIKAAKIANDPNFVPPQPW